MQFGNFTLDDPRCAPGLLDTATWDEAAVCTAVMRLRPLWPAIQAAIQAGRPCPTAEVTLHASALVRHGSVIHLPATLADGQWVILRMGPPAAQPSLGPSLITLPLVGTDSLEVMPAHLDLVHRFCRQLAPANAPQALGAVPRLGIGCRMTTAVWAGAFPAMDRHHFAANTIQNSVRELNLWDDLQQGRPPVKNYACGFGEIECGYTGSTFEGLWLSGVLAALAHPSPLRYGADADHIQPKRADPSLSRPLAVLRAARHYTFYTLDVSDVLDYAALAKGPSPANLAAKYDRALEITGELCRHLRRQKDGEPFDLELSIDEHPPEVPAFACLTTAEEVAFLIERIHALGLPITHLAPNLGVEKGVDYRHPSGLPGLIGRTRTLGRLAAEAGLMLDVHSADDLGPATRQALRQALEGRVHYKISPSLQLMYAEILAEQQPGLFYRWWEDAQAYARKEAEAGSEFARRCLADPGPQGVHHPVFHHFSFAFLGRGREAGFPQRAACYRLPGGFHSTYADRVAAHLGRLAADLF